MFLTITTNKYTSLYYS